jgi:hypothetical protein
MFGFLAILYLDRTSEFLGGRTGGKNFEIVPTGPGAHERGPNDYQPILIDFKNCCAPTFEKRSGTPSIRQSIMSKIGDVVNWFLFPSSFRKTNHLGNLLFADR